MGHTKPHDLADLHAELAAIAALDRVVQKSPGIFYLAREPFLHFHDKDGERWADLKVLGAWEKLELPFAASARARSLFLRRVKTQHASGPSSALGKAKPARAGRRGPKAIAK